MAYMYLCKVSVNNKNYNMDESVLQKELNNMVISLDSKLSSVLPDNKGIVKFITLEKNIELGYVAGRLIKIFKDDLKIYDSLSDDIVDLPNDKLARSATFYFDIAHEMVAFTVGQYFSKNQFCQYLERLLNAHVDKEIFKVSLRLNEDEFREKLAAFEKIIKINISIIPKNPGRNDFNNWYATPETMETVRATELRQIYISEKSNETGLDIDNPYMNNMINGVSSGYGKMEVVGVGIAGDTFSVNSAKDAVEKKYIDNNQKFSISSIKEIGEKFIISVLSKKLIRGQNGKN